MFCKESTWFGCDKIFVCLNLLGIPIGRFTGILVNIRLYLDEMFSVWFFFVFNLLEIPAWTYPESSVNIGLNLKEKKMFCYHVKIPTGRFPGIS